MSSQNKLAIKNIKNAGFITDESSFCSLNPHASGAAGIETRTINISDFILTGKGSEISLSNTKKAEGLEKEINIPAKRKPHLQSEMQAFKNAGTLFRLCVKNGEHVYARANDIIMIESCDHLVNVYLSSNDKLKKAIRANTLKDFLLLLPSGQFIRIGRFCAVNTHRLSGASFTEQTFEFDFKVSIKLKHALAPAVFKNIGK